MNFLLAASILITSTFAMATDVCQKFLDRHPIVIYSDFKLGSNSYRYTISHTRLVSNCILDTEFNIATIEYDGAVNVQIQKLINNKFEFIIEKKFNKFKVNLNTDTAYYPLQINDLPNLVTARKARSNRLMTTYVLGDEKITVESDYLR